jgi:voltage-gated potassium channel
MRGSYPRGTVRPTSDDARVASDQRPHIFAGLGLPLRAAVAMARDRDERAPLLLVISLLIVGTVFYTLVEGWNVVDAVYFSSMSLATVGYGDIVPETDAGKIFTVVYVLAGIGILVSFFTALASKTLAMQAERIRIRQAARERPPQ